MFVTPPFRFHRSTDARSHLSVLNFDDGSFMADVSLFVCDALCYVFRFLSRGAYAGEKAARMFLSHPFSTPLAHHHPAANFTATTTTNIFIFVIRNR